MNQKVKIVHDFELAGFFGQELSSEPMSMAAAKKQLKRMVRELESAEWLVTPALENGEENPLRLNADGPQFFLNDALQILPIENYED